VVVWFAQRPPRVDAVVPETIAAGDSVTIEGVAFGSSGQISLDNRLIPPSMVQRWTNRLIVFSMPRDLRSGLMSVATDSGRSNAVFVTLKEDLPVVVGRQGPEVTGVRPEQLPIGSLLRISGRSFGHRSAMAAITFSTPGGDVTIRGSDPHVVRWSDDLIELVVPDVLAPGVSTITINGAPMDATVEVAPWNGDREFGSRTRFAVRIAVAAEGADEGLAAVMPAIPVGPAQPDVQLLRENATSTPTPLGRGVVYPFGSPAPREATEDGEEPVLAPQRFERVSLVDRRSVRWDLDGDAASEILLEPWFRRAFHDQLGEASGIPVRAPAIDDLRRRRVDLAQSIERILAAVHATTIAALEPSSTGVDDPLLAIADDEAASAMAYATLAVALARNAGVPARRHFGLLVGDGGAVIPHAWVEFFLPGVGWIPADPAVGDGILDEEGRGVLEFYGEDPATATLGAIDGRRVTIAIDGEEIIPLYPSGSMLENESIWAHRALRIESARRTLPEELQVRWEAPELFVGIE
jgi:transglutaminase-like putative cysteine protease